MPIFIKPKNSTKSTPLVFYVFHLPLLLLILGIFTLVTFFSTRITQKTLISSSLKQDFGNVLGDDDDDDNEGSGKDGDEDENEDDDNDNDEDENDEDEDEDAEDENEFDNNDSDDDALEEDRENEFDDHEEADEKTKTEERIQNSDGTYSLIKTESEGDKVKIEIKTFSPFGDLMREEKHEGTSEGFESETEDNTGNKLKIRMENNKTLIKREGVTGLNNFPLFIDSSTGDVYVKTPNKDVKLGVMPQAIIEKAESSDDVDEVEEVEIESTQDDALEFKITTKKTEKLFGLFEMEIPSLVFYKADNGEYIRSEQAFTAKVLDFLSF